MSNLWGLMVFKGDLMNEVNQQKLLEVYQLIWDTRSGEWKLKILEAMKSWRPLEYEILINDLENRGKMPVKKCQACGSLLEGDQE